MAEGYRGMRTEHAGAKNGGGHWGTRAEAKRASRKRRRQTDFRMEKSDEEEQRQPLDDDRRG